MSSHWDYADKTKAERRERGKEKKRERMDQGKRVKLLDRLVQERAEKARQPGECSCRCHVVQGVPHVRTCCGESGVIRPAEVMKRESDERAARKASVPKK